MLNSNINYLVFFKDRTFLKTILELESITDLHILSDIVTDFLKCPKKRFNNILLTFFSNWIHKNLAW